MAGDRSSSTFDKAYSKAFKQCNWQCAICRLASFELELDFETCSFGCHIFYGGLLHFYTCCLLLSRAVVVRNGVVASITISVSQRTLPLWAAAVCKCFRLSHILAIPVIVLTCKAPFRSGTPGPLASVCGCSSFTTRAGGAITDTPAGVILASVGFLVSQVRICTAGLGVVPSSTTRCAVHSCANCEQVGETGGHLAAYLDQT